MNNLVFLFIKYTKFRGSAYQINCIQSKRLIEVYKAKQLRIITKRLNHILQDSYVQCHLPKMICRLLPDRYK